MSRKRAQTKSTASRPAIKPEENQLAYELWLAREEIWLTSEVEHGPVEERDAAEDLLLVELQGRGVRKRSGNKISRRTTSK